MMLKFLLTWLLKKSLGKLFVLLLFLQFTRIKAVLLAYELNHVLSWGPDFALIETGYYRITKNLSLLHHTSIDENMCDMKSCFFFICGEFLDCTNPKKRNIQLWVVNIFISFWKHCKTFEKFISFKPEFSMRPEYNRKLGKWTLSTHVLPVYALSLSLGMFAFDTTT